MRGEEGADDRHRWMEHGRILDGRYRVERSLGHGGMGCVIAATDLRASRRVAIKVPHPNRCGPREAARFVREAQSVARLASPHVPRIYESGVLVLGGVTVPFMALEYLDGVDLATRLATGPLDLGTAAGVAMQACHALAEAHALGIVHRDIKPANLFLTGSGVKVLDFGISRSRDSNHTTTGALLGSPAYMAPERMRPSSAVDGRGDLWSLGIVLFEALTGHLPFQSDVFPDLCLKILMDDPALDDLPPALAPVIQRCLEKQPEDRYQTASELIDALRPFATMIPAIHRGRRRRGHWGLAALAVAVVLLGPVIETSIGDVAPAAPADSTPDVAVPQRITAGEPAMASPSTDTPRVERRVTARVEPVPPPTIAAPEPIAIHAERDPLASPF